MVQRPLKVDHAEGHQRDCVTGARSPLGRGWEASFHRPPRTPQLTSDSRPVVLLPAVVARHLAPVTAAGDLGHVLCLCGLSRQSIPRILGGNNNSKKKMLMGAGFGADADRGKAQRCIDFRPPRISLRLGSDRRTGNTMTGHLCAECETLTESPLRAVSS